VRVLASLVPPPQVVNLFGTPVVRYAEQTIHQAIVLKLARYASTLNACEVLMHAGFTLEQAALQRLLDETGEDIEFLTFSIIFGETTDRHTEYLDNFWKEEFDNADFRQANQDRAMVKREKIRAFVTKFGEDPSGAGKAAKSVYKNYSGYVHGAAPHICDLYNPESGRFLLRGLTGTVLHQDAIDDFRNVAFRGIHNAAFAAKAFGQDAIVAQLIEHMSEFDAAFGMHAVE
jgi:hypothetical protein